MPAVAKRKPNPKPAPQEIDPVDLTQLPGIEPLSLPETTRKPRMTLAEMANAGEPAGLVCRVCGCCDFLTKRVLHKVNGRIQRKRVCRHCGTAKITVEQEAFQK